MKHFDKLKDQIRSEKSALPDGFDWDDIRDGIFDKMQEGSTPMLPSSTIFNKFIFLGAGFLFGILFISFLFLQREKIIEPVFTDKNDLKGKSKLSTNVEKSNTSFENLYGQDDAKTETIAKHDLGQNTLLTHSNLTTSKANGSIKNENKLTEQEKFDKVKSIFKPTTQESKLKMSSDFYADSNEYKNKTKLDLGSENLPSSIINNDSKGINSRLVTKASNNKSLENKSTNGSSNDSYGGIKTIVSSSIASRSQTFNSIDVLPTLESRVSSLQKAINLKSPELSIKPMITPIKKSLWSIEFSGGWNTWSYGLTSPQVENSLYANTKSEYGFSFSSRLSRKISNKLNITSGFDVDLMYKKFNIVSTRLENREVKDAVLSFKINAISGIKQETIGDAIVVDTFKRTVKNYNKYQVISIPLIVNYNILKKSNWSLDIGVGPSFSFLTNYHGKYLEDNELLSFDKSSNLYTKTPKIALNVNLQLRKKFVNHYFFGFRIDYKNHFSNWSEDNQIVSKPKIVSGSIVLGKEF